MAGAGNPQNVTVPIAQPGQNVFNQSANAYTGALQGTQGGMNYQPQNVSAQNVNTQYGYNPAMVGAQNVGAQNVNTQYGYNPAMVGAQNVGTQFGYNPNTVQADTAASAMGAYNNPYTQQVIDSSMGDLERQRQMQQRTMGAQATAAGAFGGSRQGIAEAETNRAYAEKGGQLAAQLRQQGFTMALGAGQQDVANRLNAGIANQNATGRAAEFGQQLGLQGQMANQNAGLQAGIANQGALGRATEFGQQTGLTAQGMNQNANLQAGIANQNAGLQAGIANQGALGRATEFGQQTGLTAQGMNQNANLQAGIANQNAGLQGAQFRMGAAGQLGNLSNLGFGYGTQLAGAQNTMGGQQQQMMQALIDAAKGQYGGFTGAPNAGLSSVLAALGAMPGGQGTTNTTEKKGLFDYITAGATALGSLCWVAREVYGEDDLRWTQFRYWLLTDAPKWLLRAYATHGEAVARVVKRMPILKGVLRPLMDRARRAAGFEG